MNQILALSFRKIWAHNKMIWKNSKDISSSEPGSFLILWCFLVRVGPWIKEKRIRLKLEGCWWVLRRSFLGWNLGWVKAIYRIPDWFGKPTRRLCPFPGRVWKRSKILLPPPPNPWQGESVLWEGERRGPFSPEHEMPTETLSIPSWLGGPQCVFLVTGSGCTCRKNKYTWKELCSQDEEGKTQWSLWEQSLGRKMVAHCMLVWREADGWRSEISLTSLHPGIIWLLNSDTSSRQVYCKGNLYWLVLNFAIWWNKVLK